MGKAQNRIMFFIVGNSGMQKCAVEKSVVHDRVLSRIYRCGKAWDKRERDGAVLKKVGFCNGTDITIKSGEKI